MPDYRRNLVPGGVYFFTVVTKDRYPLFADDTARRILGDIMRDCIRKWPFEVKAIVLLPEHLHAIWELPQDDAEYSRRWAWIKKEFTKAWLENGGAEQPVSQARQRRHDRGVWQPRYWEHTIADEHDFDRHFDYIHFNPVKHGHVTCPNDWPHSSFHRWVNHGVYQQNWGCQIDSPLSFDDLNETAMEM